MARQTSTKLEGGLSDTVFNASPAERPWQKYNLAPAARTVKPRSVFRSEGSVRHTSSGDEQLQEATNLVLEGRDAIVTLDFGVNTAGMVSLDFGPSCDSDQRVSLAFAESKAFIDRTSDRSMDFGVSDGVLTVDAASGNSWTCPVAQMRGAFRYLTIFAETDGKIEITGVRTLNNMMPSMGENLRNYPGYFYSSDSFLNQMWYAGAYTVQLATIPTDTGRRSDWVHEPDCWHNDTPAALPGTLEVLTDGARRDRSVWSGDRAISALTNFVALNNSAAARAGVDFMFDQQTEEGMFPYACKPIWLYGSDTYHLWTLVALHNAYFFDGGGEVIEWVKSLWDKLVKGMNFSLAKIDENGLLRVTAPLDWGRNLLRGHNLEANCILYQALANCAELARVVICDETLASKWEITAMSVKEAINTHLWNPSEGMYMDYIGSTVCAQDGNCLAIWYGIADSSTRAKLVSKGLTRNWNEFGAVAPESSGMISTFCSSMELIAHMRAGQPSRSLSLLRTMWGYIWNSPYAVQSSLIEGYFQDGRCFYPFTRYDPAYISHAHPWATGPTIVLTLYYVGIRLLSSGHESWIFEPQIEKDEILGAEDELFAMSGFMSGKGFFSAGWKVRREVAGDSLVLEMAVKAPESTIGEISIPSLSSRIASVELDGSAVDARKLEGEMTENRLRLRNVGGGSHTVTITYNI